MALWLVAVMAAPLGAQMRAGNGAAQPDSATPSAAAPSALHAAMPPIPNGDLGYTFCRNGLAETWIRADVIGTAQADEVLAHEAVHRAQAAAAPSCEEFFASVRSARRVVEVEIPAYCAQWRVVAARGAERAATLREYAYRISAQSGAMENRIDVLEMLKRACP
ncbi:MAG TPA: hypothetical protein VFW66_14710 [Gemmatimonadales bacterium]|nr:hypothetical protein [Gemmatimonadales bacterium]